MVVLGVLVGGALGALARYGVTLLLHGWQPSAPQPPFPLATLLVNVAGCFLLGLLATSGSAGRLSPHVRVALGTGFLGALTTFSTFALEGDALLRQGRWSWAALSVAANLALGYLALVAGRVLGSRLAG